MNDKNKKLHYRYKTIIDSPDQKSRTKTRWSCNLKDKRLEENESITKYKSIREMKKEDQSEKCYTQRKLEGHPYMSRFKKEQTECQLRNELIEIVKMKLHKNGQENPRVKTECTMNRGELKQFLKKKKPSQFTTSKSLEEIKKMYPKKIDIFINHLKMKVQALQRQAKTNNSTIQREYGPTTQLKTQKISVRQHIKQRMRNPIKIETPKLQKPTSFLTSYDQQETGEVTGWQIEPIDENKIRSNLVLINKIRLKHQ